MSEHKPEPLTPKERDVLSLAGYGFSNREIAQTLGNAPETIKHHLKVISRKLGAVSRFEAAYIANKAGWL